jgi:EpsI family protein
VSRALRDSLLASLLMVVAALGAWQLTPTRHWPAEHRPPDLESVVPAAFGDWHVVSSNAAALIDPTVTQRLGDIYDQTLARSYVNAQGYVIMLSVAYGWQQSRTLQIHRPEVCYVAQGFSVSAREKIQLQLATGPIPAMRMRSALGARLEPVTYWVRIGDEIVRGNLEQGMARIRYGLKGYIADGLLFRVSSIDGDPARAFALQEDFVQALLGALTPDRRRVLAGQSQL